MKKIVLTMGCILTLANWSNLLFADVMDLSEIKIKGLVTSCKEAKYETKSGFELDIKVINTSNKSQYPYQTDHWIKGQTKLFFVPREEVNRCSKIKGKTLDFSPLNVCSESPKLHNACLTNKQLFPAKPV